MKALFPFLVIVLVFLIPIFLFDSIVEESEQLNFFGTKITVFPESPLQGEPVLFVIENANGELTSVSLGKENLKVFPFKEGNASLFGIDLRAATGTRTLSVVSSDGTEAIKEIMVRERVRASAPLGIPTKLGGNTPVSQTRLVNDLTSENTVLDALSSVEQVLWEEGFELPLALNVVTDAYGYSRLTGPYSLAHKGTDFRADIGTKVYAMNKGKVVLAREFRVYGKTIVIDHGLGVHTLYMHLSRIDVEEGDVVDRTQVIGLSGTSGYADAAHLHVSIRINGISIDPIAFVSLFK